MPSWHVLLKQVTFGPSSFPAAFLPSICRKRPCHAKQEHFMPKMKTKSGAAKRFTVRAGGTIKRSQAFKRHILTKKSTKNKRQLRGTVGVHSTDTTSVR